MNRRPSDIDARLAAWLEEGPSNGPESLLSSTFARARSTRQDRVGLQRLTQPTRFHAMNTMLKVAVVAAFALAVGVTILPRGPERAAAPAPSPSPSPSPALLEGYAPALAAGTYQQSLGTNTWTVTVPEGWEEFYGLLWADVDGVSNPGTAGGPGEVALGWWEVGNIFTDPCHWQDSLADPPVGPTVDDLATAFVEQVGRDGSASDVVFAGHPAKRVELSTPADLDVATCDEGVYLEFMAPGESPLSLPGGDQDPAKPVIGGRTDVLYILDIDGTRYMMRTWHEADAAEEDLAEMEAMLASSVIDPPAPMPLHQGSLDPGTYTVAPFGGAEWAPCGPAPEPCPEASVDDAIRFTFTVPDGWAGAPFGNDIWLADGSNSGPDGAGLLMGRGGWVYSDPCTGEDPDVPVGPTVDDFVEALVDQPMLDPTEPVDVTVDGYPGKYLTLLSPADQTDCQYFWAWAPTHYAQGPSNQWHMWVIDVNGVRVVLHGSEFPETAPERSAELRAIVDSMEIDVEPPAPDPSPASSPAA